MFHGIPREISHREILPITPGSHLLTGLIEMDDASFGSSKPGKRGRGAGGKATVMVTVEIEGSEPRFTTMLQVKSLNTAEVHVTFTYHL